MRITRVLRTASASALAIVALLLLPAAPANADVTQVQFGLYFNTNFASPGEAIELTITASNSGADPVTLDLVIPVGFLLTNADVTPPAGATLDEETDSIRWAPALAGNGSASLTVLATIKASANPGTLLSASVTSSAPGPDCDGNCYALLGISQSAGSGGDSLPKTGAQPALVVAAAALLLAVGAVLAGRRRTKRS